MYDVIKYSLTETFSFSILNRVTRHGIKAFALTVEQRLVVSLRIVCVCVGILPFSIYIFILILFLNLQFTPE